MATRYTDEFRRDAVRIATTSGLTRPKVASDFGVGLSTLNKWVQKHQHDDLMSGPHEDVEKKNTRLRKEVRLLREERGILKTTLGFGPPVRGRNSLCYASALEGRRNLHKNGEDLGAQVRIKQLADCPVLPDHFRGTSGEQVISPYSFHKGVLPRTALEGKNAIKPMEQVYDRRL